MGEPTPLRRFTASPVGLLTSRVGCGGSVSLAAAAGLHFVPDRWIGLLGLIPIGFGIWGLRRLRGTDPDSRPPLASTATRIATVTFANGADNISVFTPLFRTLHVAGVFAVSTLYLAPRGVWCAAGALLGSHRATITRLSRISHWLVPVVFVAIGVLIIITSGILTTILRTL